MKTARQFITAMPATKTDRNGAWGCCSPSIPRGIMAGAVSAALATCVLSFAPAVFAQRASDSLGELLAGEAAFGDWRTDAPLVRRKITDLPPPYATRSASNPPRLIARPVSAVPNVPPGFQVELLASNLRDPRMVRVAPNGDIFIAESEPGRIRVLRAADGAAKPSSNDVFASGLDQPPVRKRLRSRRFSSATRSRSTFRGKRTGNCASSMPDGTIRRSFSRTAAGKFAGVMASGLSHARMATACGFTAVQEMT
jgi:glucose/arabinose dehydrogenase